MATNTQTITATKGEQSVTFRFDYRTLATRIIDSTGARTVPQDVAMQILHSLPEAGWVCR